MLATEQSNTRSQFGIEYIEDEEYVNNGGQLNDGDDHGHDSNNDCCDDKHNKSLYQFDENDPPTFKNYLLSICALKNFKNRMK